MGHFSLAYILSKSSSKLTTTSPNLPLVLTLSVIPDIDIFFQHFQLLDHRGPTHSIFTVFAVFAPFFIIYRRKAVPYFLAYFQHAFPSDYIAGGGIQLLWPISQTSYGIEMSIYSPTNIALEWILFLTFIAIMVKTKETLTLFKSRSSNLILFVPVFTVLLPTFLSYPLAIPLSLVPPHLVYLLMFSTSLAIGLVYVAKKSAFQMNLRGFP